MKMKEVKEMRAWRVGTYSMGFLLIFLGIFLLFFHLLKWQIPSFLRAFWPLLFILLGMEIVVYSYMNKKEHPPIKYDFFSIFFVGTIGFIGVCFTIASSTGVIEKIEKYVLAEVYTMDLPVFQEEMAPELKRIVVETVYPITIESTNERNIVAFGTVQATLSKNEKLVVKPEDFIQKHQSGDTLYVTFKTLPFAQFHSQGEMKVTFLIPADVRLEVIGNHHEITLRTRTLVNHWHIDEMSKVNIFTSSHNNMLISAKNVQSVNEEEVDWKIERIHTPKRPEKYDQYSERPPTNEENKGDIKEASFKLGEGKYTLQVTNVHSLNVEIVR